MNTQEVFNRNWEVFVVQGYDRARDGESCVYVTENHPGCAIGCCLADELKEEIVDLGLNKKSISAVIRMFPRVGEYFDTNLGFLIRMQLWHDNRVNGDPESAASGLRDIALRYELEVPETDNG